MLSCISFVYSFYVPFTGNEIISDKQYFYSDIFIKFSDKEMSNINAQTCLAFKVQDLSCSDKGKENAQNLYRVSFSFSTTGSNTLLMVSILVVSIGHLQVLLYWHDVYRSNNVVIVIFMLINFVIIKTQVRFHQANLTTGEFCLFYICPYLVIFYYQSRFKDWSVCSLCRLIYKSVLDTQNYSVTLSLQFQQFVYTTAGRLLILRIESDQK